MENKCITCKNRNSCPFFSADPEDTECVYEAMANFAENFLKEEIERK